MTLAAVLAEQGRTIEAAEERKEAASLTKTAINRQRANFELNTGDELLKKGSIAEAIVAYHEAIANDPDLAQAHSQLAVALQHQGRTAEAMQEQTKADELASKMYVR
jgi:tetratricopeptide (TPR) repeat protein